MPNTPKTLGQLVAVERATRQLDNEYGSKIKHGLKDASVTGQVKTYRPFNETPTEAERLPAQFVEVQKKVEDALDEARKYSVPAMDIVASKDTTNTRAKADVIVAGRVLIPEVPVSHLLWLEKYLNEWRGFLAVLPTLKPDRHWERDSTDTRLSRARTEETVRTKKEVRGVILAPATDKHPAQAQAVQEDVPIGVYETTVLSGAVTETRKKELLDNLNKVQLAVKEAIAVANRTAASDVHEGNKVFEFIFGR